MEDTKDNLTIKFVVLGWYYDKYEELIDGLIEMKNGNPGIVDVFYSCHREPIDKVKENFGWKLFENKGLEWGGYQQAFEHLDIKDNEIYFFINDDLVIKNWDFVNRCISMFNGGSKVIGNGSNYGFYLDPEKVIVHEADEPIPWGTVTKWIDEVKEENQHIFDEPLHHKTIRGSFIAIKGKSLKEINGFEVANCPYEKEDKTQEFGNVSLNMFGYKISKIFGNDFIDYLGREYANSEYIYEPTGENRY